LRRAPTPLAPEEAHRRQAPILAGRHHAIARQADRHSAGAGRTAAEAEAVTLYGLDEEQRKRLMILERE